MGSFNVACAVSRLTIAPGDPAVFLPLRQNVDYFFKDFGVIYESPFVPHPPLIGVYDDYGRIRDIQPSAYHDHWRFGANFKAIATGKREDEVDGYTYTWVRGEIWDHMIRYTKQMTHQVARLFDQYIAEKKSFDELIESGLTISATPNFNLTMAEYSLRLVGVLKPLVNHLREIQPEITALANFVYACDICNVLVAPIPAGPQGGDLKASQHLAQIIYSTATQDLNTYNDKQDDEDLED